MTHKSRLIILEAHRILSVNVSALCCGIAHSLHFHDLLIIAGLLVSIVQ